MRPQARHTATCERLKVAWVREDGHPVGQPAPGRLRCPCGNAPLTQLKPDQGNIECFCGALYTWDGWIIRACKPTRSMDEAGVCVEFQEAMARIAVIANKTPAQVYGLWRHYSDHNSDMSCLLSEFVENYRTHLGNETAKLRAAAVLE